MELKSESPEPIEQIYVCDSDSIFIPAEATSSVAAVDLNQPNNRGYDVSGVDLNKKRVNMFHGLSTKGKNKTSSSPDVDEQLKKKPNRQGKNRVAARTLRNSKTIHLEQMEKHIQELLSKNQSLVARCTDLNNLNKSLTSENAELQNKLQQTNDSSSHNANAELNNKKQKTNDSSSHNANKELNNKKQKTNDSPSLGDCSQTTEEPAIHVDKQEISSTYILDPRGLADLWNEISLTPLPHCRCSKLGKTVAKKQMQHKRKL